MRAEYAAALTNFLLVLAIAVGASMASSSSGAHVYSNPTKAAITAVLIPALFAAPLAILAFWRTWVFAERSLRMGTTGWSSRGTRAGISSAALSACGLAPSSDHHVLIPAPCSLDQPLGLGPDS